MQTKRLVGTALVFGFLVVCAAAVRIEALPKSISGGGVTLDKPQSKLWYHDGSWWAILPDGSNLRFYRMVDGTFVPQTFPNAVLAGSKNKHRVDVLWDGTHLFVLIYKGVLSSFAKYTYNASPGPGQPPRYEIMSGYPAPVTLAAGVETATIAQDNSTPNKKLWIAYEAGLSPNFLIYVIWSVDHLTWSGPIQLNTNPPDPAKADDIAAVVAFDNKIGVLWSDQSTSTNNWTNNWGFRVHDDTNPDPNVWGPVEWLLPTSPPPPTRSADDHFHLTVTPMQDLLAVVKSDAGNIVKLFARWDGTTSFVKEEDNVVSGVSTRPIVLHEQDNDEVYVFYTDWTTTPSTSTTWWIEYKKAKIIRPQQGTPYVDAFGPAITVMRKSDVQINDVTSTKDPVDTDSSIVVAASGLTAPGAATKSAYYTSIVMHAETQTGGSTGANTVVSAPLTGKRGHLYLAAIVTTPPVDVIGVAGLGLENWQQVAVQCSAKDQTEVTVYRAYATSASLPPLSSGAVTATLASDQANAVIAVSRYSGVDLGTVTTNPIGNVKSGNARGDGVCDPAGGTTDTDTYLFTLGSSPSPPIIDGAVLYGAVAMLDTSHTAGLNFTERKEVAQGSGSDTAGLAVEDKPTPAAGSDTVDGTFSGLVDWAGIAIELRPPYTP